VASEKGGGEKKSVLDQGRDLWLTAWRSVSQEKQKKKKQPKKNQKKKKKQKNFFGPTTHPTPTNPPPPQHTPPTPNPHPTPPFWVLWVGVGGFLALGRRHQFARGAGGSPTRKKKHWSENAKRGWNHPPKKTKTREGGRARSKSRGGTSKELSLTLGGKKNVKHKSTRQRIRKGYRPPELKMTAILS